MKFTTSNYGVTTTPEKEYNISTGQIECPAEDMVDKKGSRVRIIQRIEKLEQLVLSRRARLTADEILAVVSDAWITVSLSPSPSPSPSLSLPPSLPPALPHSLARPLSLPLSLVFQAISF